MDFSIEFNFRKNEEREKEDYNIDKTNETDIENGIQRYICTNYENNCDKDKNNINNENKNNEKEVYKVEKEYNDEDLNKTEKNDEESENSNSYEETSCPEFPSEEINNCVNKDILKVILDDKELDFKYEQQINDYFANQIKNQEKPIYKEKKPKRRLRFKYGDWVCLFCLNYNFSFRNTCNRCKKKKEETEKIFSKFEFSLQRKS